ncbi:uncharacterized protein N7443_010307 [Penicillium atrosanguineum]|uniref:Major facilitator superfamily (MFS) profile domain-containing protein n=1 Tax=Penicillium atrosanguineum TaxID=1132637 RepID=A0A9W9PRT0_9EURO|nr:uncharacterized protein N7443_010307 [Penicillium atrosanguineum]KAJ5290054.1 hypothetical protein N7443_010307 [Penicillium atrosanguineum]KAJ5307877.1 hypothetical protein N7476_008533 [Penicillium atrosanguineum]
MMFPEIERDIETPLISPKSEERKAAQQCRLQILLPVYTVSFLLLLAMSVIAAAQADVVENIICRRYHDPELDLTNQPLDCKSEAVQSEVALVQGWGDSLAQIPGRMPQRSQYIDVFELNSQIWFVGIFFVLPYGLLADKCGRKPVFILSFVGIVLSDTWIKIVYFFPDTFSIRMVWAAPILQVIGGGRSVGALLTYTIIADVVPRAER